MMNSFHTDDDTTFWPCGEDQTTAWSEAVSNEQAALAFNWDVAADPDTSQNLDWVFTGTFDDLPNVVDVGLGPLGDLEAAVAGMLNPGASQSPNIQGNYDHTNTDFVAPSLVPTPALTMSETIASPPADAPWDGYTITPAQLMAEPQSGPFTCGPTAAPPLSPNDLAWLFEQPDQFPSLAPSYAVGDGGVVTHYSTNIDFAGTVGYTFWGSAQINAPTPSVSEMGASRLASPAEYIPASTGTILRKRPRGEEETSSDLHDNNTHGPHKRVKTKMMNGVLEAAGSTNRAHPMPTTRTLVEINSKSEAAGRGAEKLTSPNAREVYYQFPQGPSVQKELVGTDAQRELPWIEGSAEEATRNHTGNVERQHDVVTRANDGERENMERRHFRIPRRMSERQLGLLDATPDDLASGTVRELKCRLCPGTGLGNWEDYRRHCDLMEAHPLRLSFCNFCGDCFARPDSLARHRKNRPAECLKVTPDEAQAKRAATEQVHEEFEESLERYLETDEKIGEPFAQRIKAMFPKSSKRGSRQQSRFKGPRA